MPPLDAAFHRSSGVQLHLTSLPGGRLGDAAFEWIDWLAAAGQSWWQMLPLGPPDSYGSPYKSASAFAAWPGLLADPRAAVSDDEIDELAASPGGGWAAGWAHFAGDGAGGREALADQVRFRREWAALRAHAARRGVRLIGDVPIYVAPGGADHRDNPELFRRGEVAGAPPDAYSHLGQLWGNPVYDWPAHRRRGYRWWTERFEHTLALFDAARIDHFRGFVSGWVVPEGAPDARSGHWHRGPGRALFDAASRRLGPRLPLIAEDLGLITPGVERLRVELGFPGMVVLQFGFDPGDPRGPHRLENHSPDRVAYTGTHDCDTLAGWLATLPPERLAEVDAALAAAGLPAGDPVWGLTELWMGSVAPLVMLQAQDLLELGSEARMNTPGRASGNWRWRLEPGALGDDQAARLRAITAAAGRAPSAGAD